MNVRELLNRNRAAAGTQNVVAPSSVALAEKVLNSINEGVIITDAAGIIQLINPAGVLMTDCETAENATGLSFLTVLKLEGKDGRPIDDSENQLLAAMNAGKEFYSRDYILITMRGQKLPIAITMVPTNGAQGDKVITFRDIAKELEEEGAQMEFVSTASHEMRTPVASIEGYLGLALNPQTATIDDRARKYLEEAHASSQHLGRLFQDLLDVTKLEDKKIRPRMIPVDMMQAVKSIADGQAPMVGEKGLKYSFGTEQDGDRAISQQVYGMVDVDFLREVLNNLIENAVKYTPTGGSIWVSVRGDSDRILINVTDTGIGISPDDLLHIFQKFYRVDNSQTREIGGTGLGLYLVKQRVEAMGGKVWAESAFGDGSTFYVSLPRLTAEEYERQKQILANQQIMQTQQQNMMAPVGTITPAGMIPPQANPAAVTQANPAAPQPAPQGVAQAPVQG